MNPRTTSIAMIFGLAAALGPAPCPAQQPEPAADGPHALVVIEDGRLLARTGDQATEIQDLTAYCLECHGGGAAAEGSDGAPRPEHTVTGLGRSHPVDTTYPDGTPGYRPLIEVSAALPLLGGRMTCLTCHAGTPDRALVVPLEGSRICTACHAK